MSAPVTQGRILRSVRVLDFVLTEAAHRPGVALGRHTHPSAALTVPLGGLFTETIEGRAYACRPGSVLFKDARVPHENRYGAGGSRTLIVENLQPLSTYAGPTTTTVEPRLSDGLPWALALRIHRRLDAGPTRLDLEELFGEILGPPPDRLRGASGTPPPSWLRRVRERLEEEWIDVPSLAELAEEGQVHPVYLARAFRRHYHRSVGGLVRRKRMDAAVAALVERRTPVSQLALELGFYDQSHFTRCFREATGMTPAAFRRRAGTVARAGRSD